MRDLMQHSSRTFAAEMTISRSMAKFASDPKAFAESVEGNLRRVIKDAVAEKCIGCSYSKVKKEDRDDFRIDSVRVGMSIRCEYRGGVCAISATTKRHIRGAAFDTMIVDEIANMPTLDARYRDDLLGIGSAKPVKPRSKDAPINETAGEW